MNTNDPTLPAVEVLHLETAHAQTPLKNRPRGRTFFLVLLLSVITSLLIVFVRDPIYRASASVLTVKPKAVDAVSHEADAEHVAIQSRLLKSTELLNLVTSDVNRIYDTNFTENDLRQILTTVPIVETNLLELRAEGAEPELLQTLVNTWASSYESFRLKEIEKLTTETTAELLDNQAGLANELQRAREELSAFRESHEIVSSEREENRSLSAIRGLNKSINAAREKEIDAVSRLDAIDEAIARGEEVVPREQKSEISRMKLDLAHLRDKLASLREQFTEAYLERDPELADLPQVITELEQDLARALEIGAQSVRSDVAQEVEAARRSVTALERDLAEKESSVQTFTQHFEQYKLLEEESSRLESLYADNEERIAKLRLMDNEKYPPLKIIESALVPETPIRPDYKRDAIIAIGLSLALALFVTWLVDFLFAKPSVVPPTGNIDIRIHPQSNGSASLVHSPPAELAKPAPRITHEINSNGSSLLPPHLDVRTISTLITNAETETRGYLSLLLSGVNPAELEKLNSRCFSDSDNTITVPGDNARKLQIDFEAWRNFDQVRNVIDQASSIPLLQKLDINLVNIARDARIENPGSINTLVIWHSYVIYLLEQGIDDDTLFQIVGRLPAAVVNQLHTFLPAEPVAQFDLTHPGLRA